LSLYLKQNRATYYSLLDSVRRDGDWEAWLAFFLEGIRQTADGAVATARRLEATLEKDRQKITARGRRAKSALVVHDALKERPISSLKGVRARTKLSFPGAASAMELLCELGISRELTGRRRNRLFAYDQYLRILSEGTEPL